MELSNIEKLAVAQAFQKVVGDAVKTKDPTNLRGAVDAEIIHRYQSDPLAPKSYEVRVLGEPVGTYSLAVSKTTDSTIKTVLEVEDRQEYMAWAFAHGFVTVDQSAVDMYFASTGEVPDGCEPKEVVVPGEVGGVVTRTTLKVDPRKVVKALGNQLEAATVQLLTEGDNDGV